LNLKKRVKHKDENAPSYTMTVYEGSGGMATLILNVGNIWREGSTSGPDRFTPGKGIQTVYRNGGWLGP